MESGFLELVKNAKKSGLFSGLLQSLTAAQVCAYTVPRGDLLIPYRDQQAALSRPTPASKKRKLSAEAGSSPSTQSNPFSRPSSAGPVAVPPFALAAYSTAAKKVKTEDEQIKQEQSQPGENGTNQPQAQQTEQQQAGTTGTEQGTGETTAYDDMLRDIEDAIHRARSDESHDEQLERAPAVTSLIERTASSILKKFQASVAKIDEQGRRGIPFMACLKDTAFALLWILESCALNTGGSALSAEVSRAMSRVTLVGALWGIVRMGTDAECAQLVSSSFPRSTFTVCLMTDRPAPSLALHYGSFRHRDFCWEAGAHYHANG